MRAIDTRQNKVRYVGEIFENPEEMVRTIESREQVFGDRDSLKYIDGSGFFRTFMQVVLPITRPAFATAGVIQFLLAWNEFQFALTLTGDTKKRTLPIALYYFKSAFASDYGAMFAATVVVAIPSIITFIILQKQVVAGLAAGSVKG